VIQGLDAGIETMQNRLDIAVLSENRKSVSHAKVAEFFAKVAKRLVSVELCGLCVKILCGLCVKENS